jgi:hypothetical protein
MRTAVNKRVAILVLLGILDHSALAVDGVYRANACYNKDDAAIGKMKTWLAEAEKYLPNVPPGDEQYFKAETERARKFMDDNDPQALLEYSKIQSTLETHPLYWAWIARADLARASEAVSKIVGPYNRWRAQYGDNLEAEKLRFTLEAIRPVKVYAETIIKIVNLQSAGKLSFLSDAGNAAADSSQGYVNLLSLYSECKLFKVMTMKPVPVPIKPDE